MVQPGFSLRKPESRTCVLCLYLLQLLDEYSFIHSTNMYWILAGVPGTVFGTENLVELKTNMVPSLWNLLSKGRQNLRVTDKYISINSSKCYKGKLQHSLECTVRALS